MRSLAAQIGRMDMNGHLLALFWKTENEIQKQRLDEVTALLNAYPGFLHEKPWGTPLLEHAAVYGNLEATKLMLDRGADVNSRSFKLLESSELTALLAAVEHGHMEVAKLLLDHGARVTDVTCRVFDFFIPPTADAPEGGETVDGIEGAERLFGSKDPKKWEQGPYNVLSYACHDNNAAMVAFLLQHGAAAVIDHRNRNDKVAADLTTDPLINSLLEFAAGNSIELPVEATALLVAQAPVARRREAVALMWTLGQLKAGLDGASKHHILMFAIREWIRSSGEEAAAAAAEPAAAAEAAADP